MFHQEPSPLAGRVVRIDCEIITESVRIVDWADRVTGVPWEPNMRGSRITREFALRILNKEDGKIPDIDLNDPASVNNVLYGYVVGKENIGPVLIHHDEVIDDAN